MSENLQKEPVLDDWHQTLVEFGPALHAQEPRVTMDTSRQNVLRMPLQGADFVLRGNEKPETGWRAEDNVRQLFICESESNAEGDAVTAHRTAEAYADSRILEDAHQDFQGRVPRETRPINGGLLTTLRQLGDNGDFLDIYDVNSSQRVRVELPKGFQFGAVDLDGSDTLTQVIVPERPKGGPPEFIKLEDFVESNPGLVERRDGLIGVKHSQIDEEGRDTVSFADPETGVLKNLRLGPNKRFQQTKPGPNGELPRSIIVTYDALGNEVTRELAHSYISSKLNDEKQRPLVDQAREAVLAATGVVETGVEQTGDNVKSVVEARESAEREPGEIVSGIFANISKRIIVDAQKRTTKNILQRNPTTGLEETVTVQVDPNKILVEDYINRGKKTEAEVAGRTWQEISHQIAVKLGTQEVGDGTKQRGMDAILDHAALTERLIQEGRVSERTAKAFWASQSTIKGGLDGKHALLTRKENLVDLKTVNQIEYQQKVNEALEPFAGHVTHQESSTYLLVNNDKVGKRQVNDRLYVSLNPNADPGAAVQIWSDVIRDAGLSDSAYFKVPDGVRNSYEGLVLYRTEDIDDATFQKLVKEFDKRCPAEYRDNEQMPTGVEVADGMFLAPNPKDLNALLRYTTRVSNDDYKSVSYNEAMAAFSELAHRLAATEPDFKQSSSPHELGKAAEKYFAELVALAGIDFTDAAKLSN